MQGGDGVFCVARVMQHEGTVFSVQSVLRTYKHEVLLVRVRHEETLFMNSVERFSLEYVFLRK
jgi:hypothetical protein